MLFITAFGYAQQRTQLRGNIINSQTKEPVAGVSVSILGLNQKEITDSNGEFFFPSVLSGKQVLIIEAAFIRSREVSVTIGTDATTLIKDIAVIVTGSPENMALVGILDESFLDDDVEGASQDISSMVILSNDVYLSSVGYQLSPFRFKVRGYDSHYEQKFINGVSFNDQIRGVFNYSAIGALNDLTRNGDVINYYAPGTFSFSSIGGAENINMRAGSYAKGGKLTASYTNRNYYLRGMASYSTGLMDDGWAVTFGVGGRYSDEGNIDGTFYRNISYALGIEKQWDEGKHSISFTTFGSPVERGQQGSSYQETYDLVGDNLYNPNWGYQNGKKRNARVVKAFDPTAILSHVWKINEYTTLTTGIGAHYNRYGGSALNWYNGPDPRPDYYRYLPSYFSEAPDVAEYYTRLWQSKDPSVTQLDWDELYRINNLSNVTGDGNAIYMIEERRSDLFETSFNSTLNTIITPRLKLNAGVGLRTSLSKQFKTVDDLLGAQYVLDIDKFAERDFPGESTVIQNDLNRPNRKVYKDDKFGYDFDIRVNSANIWLQNEYTSRKFDIHYGMKVSYTEFQRKGHMRNGRYPDSSYGKGKSHNFLDFAFKTGLTYKISGRHFITANVNVGTQSPLPNTAYVSPRITDNIAKELESEKIFSADINYIFSLPRVNGRVSVFRTAFFDQMDRVSYYHDSQRTFINHVLTGVDKVHQGFELGLTYKLDNNWSFDLAGTVAEYFYSNNPMGTISFENGKLDNEDETVYLKDYYVGGTPQIAGTLGVNYFYDYWFLGLNVNGFARNYLQVAPLRRLASNYQIGPDHAGVDPSNPDDMEAFNKLTAQERFGSGYTVDVSVGKIFYLRNRRSVNFNFSVNNIFNRKNIRTGGYESGRMDVSYPDKFGSKYYYMQGINCFLNASYRF